MVSRGYGKRTRGVKVDLVFKKIKAKTVTNYRSEAYGIGDLDTVFYTFLA